MAQTDATVVDTSSSPHARLKPVAVSAVQLTDRFWRPRLQVNRRTTLPSQYQRCEETGRIDNFRRASGKKDIAFQGIFFNDSDVYKWMEAVAWALAAGDDPDLSKLLQTVIAEVADAQQPDGYLNSYFMFDKAKERWTNLKDLHEMYCAGHLIQAAVADARSTGSQRFLSVARKLADHLCERFGPEEKGKKLGACGHEEIEMALVELYRATGERKYLAQAQFFLDVRGRGVIGGGAYHQDHKPFRELDRMIGHAVRMLYLTCGAADIYAETGDQSLLDALHRLWANLTSKQMYVSGGAGSRWEGEAFGKDYELPNERAYAETCAAIASVMLNARLLAIEGDAKYADLLEHTLYNAVLPGISLDGQEYFYQNPLADDGQHRRQGWFGCACCPPNVSRLFASLPGYFYSVDDRGLWIHLYAGNVVQLTLPGGQAVKIVQKTQYPWDGRVRLEIDAEGEFALHLRVPGWCGRSALLMVNEQRFAEPGPGYATISRRWRRGDVVELLLPMEVRRVQAHPRVRENAGRVALLRGPILYCLEAADHPRCDARDAVLGDDEAVREQWRPELLGGVVTLHAQGQVREADKAWDDSLYQSIENVSSESKRVVELTAIPYFAWANRSAGPMTVWISRG